MDREERRGDVASYEWKWRSSTLGQKIRSAPPVLGWTSVYVWGVGGERYIVTDQNRDQSTPIYNVPTFDVVL